MDAQMISTWLRETPLGWALLALIGAAAGSFLNVIIYRLPRGLSVVRPRSHCTSCGRKIAPHDLIPVLSFLLLRGRCRGCGARIALRYPAVEALGAILTVLVVSQTAGLALAAVRWVFALALIAVLFIDYDFQIIPDAITLPGVVVGLAFSLVGPIAIGDALLGVAIGGGGLLLVALAYQWIARREGLGMGDVKLMAMVGAFLGWQGALATLVIGSCAGSLVGTGLLISHRGTRHTALPFGSFLAPAAWVVLLAGEALWRAYLSLMGG